MKVGHIRVVKLVLLHRLIRLPYRWAYPPQKEDSGVEPDNVSFISKDITHFQRTWYPGQASNLHQTFVYQLLRLASLPIPPPRRNLEHREGLKPPVATLQAAALIAWPTVHKTKRPSSFQERAFVFFDFIDYYKFRSPIRLLRYKYPSTRLHNDRAARFVVFVFMML